VVVEHLFFCLGAFFLSKPSSVPQKAEIHIAAQSIPDQPQLAQQLNQEQSPPLPPAHENQQAGFLVKSDTDFIPEMQLSNATTPTVNYQAARMHIPEDFDYAYEEIPILSNEEIKQTKKGKLKMLKEIVRKKTYLSIPMSYTKIEDKAIAIKGFYIKSGEVTNLEYRTFLNDLLVNGKEEEYLKSRPGSNGQKLTGIEKALDVYYFTSPRFNDYPAVNMSREGAELYCKWLTNALREAIASGDVRWSGKEQPTVRLPYEEEWIYAARACDTAALDYPWSKINQGVQNEKGCYLCNFNCRSSQQELKKQDATKKQDNSNKPNGSTGTTASCAQDSLITTQVYSYNPNDRGSYCMSGNVAEMVWYVDGTDQGIKTAKSMSGSWRSAAQQVKIESEERNSNITEGQADTGFRPVLT
jgi:formylglycine-generating enzyme required for sulfatase activity